MQGTHLAYLVNLVTAWCGMNACKSYGKGSPMTISRGLLVPFVPLSGLCGSAPNLRAATVTADVSASILSANGTRIDHNKFTNCIQYAISWDGQKYGLIDHNQQRR